MNKLFVLYFFCFFSLLFLAQEKPALIWPLDSPRVLTGNFGELRPNHFHTGLDFSTNGKENLQVYAIEEGYVSRIRVSPFGYGKVLYVTHGNNKVSVYAHLNAFSMKIDKVLIEEQRAKQSYEVDFYPKPWSVYVRKNEIIGLSGNTGSSTGPHLHFELRDEKSEVPLNPLNFYHITDNIPPVLGEVAFYDLSDTLTPQSLLLVAADPAKASDTLEFQTSILGVAFSGYDQYLRDGNHNNVYAARIYLDNQLIYHHELSQIGFDDFRYVNEYCDNFHHQKFQKCFLPGQYPNYLYPAVRNKGRILLKDSKAHNVRLCITDESGNPREFSTYVRATQQKEYSPNRPLCDALISCGDYTCAVLKGLCLRFPKGSIFNDLPLNVENRAEEGVFILAPGRANFRMPMELGMSLPQKFADSKGKLVLKSENGVVLPDTRNDSLFFSLKNLGIWALTVDKESPEIKATKISGRKGLRVVNSRLQFRISDNLSGISTYKLFVNNTWVVAEYDPRTHLLTYVLDESTPGGPLELRLEVCDKVGNFSKMEFKVKR